MKRLYFAPILCLALSWTAFAQSAPADAPASRADIERYLDAIHYRTLLDSMVDAMAKPLHSMVHEQYVKNQDKLPADFEPRENNQIDDMLSQMPWDEMTEAMLPVYQKHFTKGDVNALVTFYQTPTGQKVLREMPAVMSESMEAMMPVVQRYVDKVTDNVQGQIAEMLKDSQKSSAKPN